MERGDGGLGDEAGVGQAADEPGDHHLLHASSAGGEHDERGVIMI